MSYDPDYAVRIVRRAESARNRMMRDVVDRAPVKFLHRIEDGTRHLRASLYIPFRRKEMMTYIASPTAVPLWYVERDARRAIAYGLARAMVRPEDVPVDRSRLDVPAWPNPENP